MLYLNYCLETNQSKKYFLLEKLCFFQSCEVTKAFLRQCPVRTCPSIANIDLRFLSRVASLSTTSPMSYSAVPLQLVGQVDWDFDRCWWQCFAAICDEPHEPTHPIPHLPQLPHLGQSIPRISTVFKNIYILSWSCIAWINHGSGRKSDDEKETLTYRLRTFICVPPHIDHFAD